MENMALIFPGQGCQFVGMGQKLFDEFPVARQTFAEADEVLGYNLHQICFNGGLTELNRAENLFVAILTSSVAAFRVFWQEIGVKPRFSAGHSLGEYTALTCCGAMTFQDALKIVRYRSQVAQAIASEETGAFTLISGVYKNIVAAECEKASTQTQKAAIACYNSPDQVMISGDREAVQQVEDRLMELTAQVTPLFTSPPFHSDLMRPVAEQLKEELANYSFRPFQWPVVSNVSALPYQSPGKIAEHLTLQLTKPVQWQATLDFFEEQKIKTVIEIGPQAILTNLLKAGHRKMTAVSFGQSDDRQVLLEAFAPKCKSAGLKPEPELKKRVPTVVTRCLAVAVCTRNYNWDDEEYQKGVIEPCQRMELLQEQLERENALPSPEQMNEALEMLKTVFATKKTPTDLQVRRFHQIFDETGTRALFQNFQI